MKKDIHPKSYPVVFVDTSSGAQFVTTSTKKTDETMKINGVEHFVIRVEVSSVSHPFYTGHRKLVDTAGRVDRFLAKVKKAQKIKEKEVKVVEEELDEIFHEEEKAQEKAEVKTESHKKPAVRKASEPKTAKPAAKAGAAKAGAKKAPAKKAAAKKK